MQEKMKTKQDIKVIANMRKNNRAITLIALVITIIVLLILAGVSIAMLTGENGILNKATTAKQKTEIAEEKEKVQLSATGALAKDEGREIKEEYLEEELTTNIGQRDVDYELTGTGPFTVKYTNSGRMYIVDTNGTVEEYVPINGKYYDTDTDIEVGGYPVTIPGGATVSGIEGEYEKVEDGLVIYITNGEQITNWNADTEPNEILDVQENYDQFVWIPVDKDSAIIEEGVEITGSSNTEKYKSLKTYVSSIESPANGPSKYPMAVKITNEDGSIIYKGILYDFEEVSGAVKVTPKDYTTTTDYREPGNVNDDASNGIIEESLQEEYKTMIERVASQGGFWVGRYETTNMNSTDFTSNAVNVVKGRTKGINKVTWYKMYEGQKAYKNSEQNTILKNSSTTSSMIWGSQWDQIMIWMRELRNESKSSYYILNSLTMGNFRTSDDNQSGLAKTGFHKVKNIYDLAGNVYDWTLEANITGSRVIRGGYYYNADVSYTRASYRGNGDPTDSNSVAGSRATLY